VCSPENAEAILVAMQCSLGKSTRQAAHELGKSQQTIQCILHSDLKLFPYKMSVLHKLSDHKEKGFTSQHEHKRIMQHPSICGFQMRPIFIWAGL
jgi:hypothetical protein